MPNLNLTLERIFGSQAWTGRNISKPCFSAEETYLAFMLGRADAPRIQDLWCVHLPSGEKRLLVDCASLGGDDRELSEEEKARRERLRMFSSGITDYQWHPTDEDQLLVPQAGRLFLHTLSSGATVCLTDGEGYHLDATFSPKGSFLSYVREKNLHVLALDSREERSITNDGGGDVCNGMAEFVVQEELHRFTGHWWSPDERWLAFEQYDESPVTLVERQEIHPDRVAVARQRYPLTGTPNVRFRLGVADVGTGEIRWIPLPEEDGYLARASWSPDGRVLALQLLSRCQQKLQLFFYEPASASLRLVFEERRAPWIEVHDGPWWLTAGAGFLWHSQRTGFAQIYRYDATGKECRALTAGEDVVTSILGVTDDSVYYVAAAERALRFQVCRASLSAPSPVSGHVAIAPFEGVQGGTLAKSGAWLAISQSATLQPPQTVLWDLRKGVSSPVHEVELVPGHSNGELLDGFSRLEFGTLKAADGRTELNYRLVKPRNMEPGKKYPAVLSLYGGPGAQLVTRGWFGAKSLFLQHWADQGFVILSVDNRGMANRGLDFAAPIHKSMGTVEVQDQREGVKLLQGLPFVDSDRIGVFGWSYGGYMTLMCLMQAPDLFRAGVAVAPVTDWTLYDTCYTERYMGTPQENPDGYERGSVFPHARNLKGRLKLIHGMADDNVLLTHSTKLIRHMVDLGLKFDLMLYPGEAHAIAGTTAGMHVHQAIMDHFSEHL